MKFKYLVIGLFVLAATLALAACQPAPTQEAVAPPPQPTQVCPEAAPCPACPDCPAPAVADVPYADLWAASPHNDATAEAFVHWNEDDPAEVPTSCAKCHSTTGYQDFLGADGSEVGKVDAAVPVGETVNCNACHNPAATALTEVTFPSAVVVTGLGDEARCMVCHQGRASSVQVNDQITKFNATDLDAVVPPMTDGGNEVRFGFINIHYFPAAATLYGGKVMGGYQYEGKVYDSKNDHVVGYDTCIGCHNPHTLQVKVEECAVCHEGVTSTEDLKNVRMVSSAPDYDGDGNTDEGMFFEIEGLQEGLYGAIQAYAKDVVGTGIVYDVAAYPYFFVDADGDGQADQGDQGSIGYNTWTPRLLKAAYNYQLSQKDPGKHAHGNKYIVQLLFDSIEDLNAGLPKPVDMSAMHRGDAGHFAGNTEAFRHWDGDGFVVPGTCVKCHTATGLPMFIQNSGSTIAAPAGNGFLCATCHNVAEFPNLYTVNTITFPSGKSLTFGEGEKANICLMCHQGRESKASVDKAIGAAASAPNEVPVNADGSPTLGFRNIHYFAAGATLFGTEAQGAYEFDGKTYVGVSTHVVIKCVECHDKHKLAPQAETCAGCHAGAEFEAIRGAQTPDYDGDGDTTEGVKGEIDTMAETLLAAIQAYTAANGLPGIVYDPLGYPYFFEDADGDGAADVKDDATVRYSQWTPTLLKAAYNYQYSQKDPGAFTHNPKYVVQFLYDSIEAAGGSVSGMTRP